MKFKSNYQKYLDDYNITYKEYLKSLHWIETKELFRESVYYKGCCWICNNKKNINIHHLTYERMGEEISSDFIELCSDCHNQLHLGIKSQGWPLFRAHVFLLEQKETEQKLPPTENEIKKAERRGKLASGWKWKRPKKLTQKQKKRQAAIKKRDARKRRKQASS